MLRPWSRFTTLRHYYIYTEYTQTRIRHWARQVKSLVHNEPTVITKDLLDC